MATHPESERAPEMVKKSVRYGASPRGAQALILAGKVHAVAQGRASVAFDDVREAGKPSLRHRIILNFEGQAEGLDPDKILDDILESLPPA